MTRCRIPEFCERYEKDIVICDRKGKRILPRTNKQKKKCVFIHKHQYCVTWKKTREDDLLNGVQEIERIFKYVKNRIKKII